MSAFDRNRVALVVARSTDGEASGLSGENVGTGYFLTSDLVLTARHVAEGPGCIFSVRAEVGESEQDRWTDAEPAWIGIGDVDAMLLRTRRQYGDWEAPPLRASEDRGDWESAGYAKIAAEEDYRNALPLSGSFGLSFGQGLQELVLITGKKIAPSWESRKGISGAPVFLSEPDSDGLIGIITDASRTLSNGLVGLPATRLLNDIHFRSIIAPSPLGRLPTTPWCLVLTREGSASDLVRKVEDVLTGFQVEAFPNLQKEPIEIPVLEAVRSTESWAATVDALARADYLIADVTSFQPAVMLLLGIRSVLRRGVTVCVTEGELAAHALNLPFNVQETRVLSFNDDDFYDDLHRDIAEGAASLTRDADYLDLPPYKAVRAPRPETWAENDAKSLLVLCPFRQDYPWRKLYPIIRAYTGNMRPVRSLDLRGPRLVGQALYEEIRWATRCLIDWTWWRPSVFFELGVRLACSEHDPLCIIQQTDLRETHNPSTDSSPGGLAQYDLLRQLIDPVVYEPARPREALKTALESWSNRQPRGSGAAPSDRVLPSAATFEVAKASFRWQQDPMLSPPHIELRQAAEQILSRDQERRPERLVLFADNDQFDSELQAAVRERWIAAWLYLKHLSSAEDTRADDIRAEFITVGRLLGHVLSSSNDPRHVRLRREIREFLRAQRTPRPTHGSGGDSG
jgi:hypothetical protein